LPFYLLPNSLIFLEKQEKRTSCQPKIDLSNILIS
jgi:hypothetical protein